MAELQQYISIGKKWWWLFLLGALLGGGTGYVVSQFEPMLYQADVTLIVGNFVQSANPNASELATSQKLAQSYAEIIKREPILRATVETLGLTIHWATLQNRVSVSLIPNTQLFEIRVTHGDPQTAKILADELARQLILQSPTTLNSEQEEQHEFIKTELTELQQNITVLRRQIRDKEDALELEVTAEGVRTQQEEIDFLQARLSSFQATYASLLAFSQENKVNNLSIIEPAVVPSVPINAGNAQRNAMAAAIFGLLLTIAVAYLVEYFDDTLKSADDVEQALNLPILATVSNIKSMRSGTGPSVISQDLFSPGVEAYRTLRTNIQFSNHNADLNILLVTSSTNGEGKSMTAANLAVIMAQTNKHVVLIDADMRRPVVHRTFRTSNRIGLSSLLVDPHLNLDTILAQRKVSNLKILPSGPVPSNPAELLSSPQMGILLDKLREQADIIIIDSPPLLAVTDASILATQVDGTLFVVESGRVHSRACQRAVGMLAQVGIAPLGVVLNKFTPDQAQDSYYYRYYTSPYHQPQPGQKR
ncbi:MAG: polysaccharide biosynthesis tyrosine autokinase [Anaerolineae bacterium]|nr:polysaccharide biosynthesis tyrosine autokinase [Anaerolineae bacterium]